jgi:hypothetical protein
VIIDFYLFIKKKKEKENLNQVDMSSSSSSSSSEVIITRITKLEIIGNVGNLSILSGAIKSDINVVIAEDDHTLIISGFTAFPIENGVQRYFPTGRIIKYPDGTIVEGQFNHETFTKPTKMCTIADKWKMELNSIVFTGSGTLESIDQSHILLVNEFPFILNLDKQAIYRCNSHKITSLRAIVSGNAQIRAEREVYAPDTPRGLKYEFYPVRDLWIQLKDRAKVTGIKVYNVVTMHVIAPEHQRVAAVILAVNACKIIRNFTSAQLKNVKFIKTITPEYEQRQQAVEQVLSEIQRAIDNSLTQTSRFVPPALVTTDSKGNFAVTEHGEKVEHFVISADIPDAIQDRPALNDTIPTCFLCLTNVALFTIVPCGHNFTCKACLRPAQATVSQCPLRCGRIKSVVLASYMLSIPNEAFPIYGLLSTLDEPGTDCLGCHKQKARVTLSCNCCVYCISCAKLKQQEAYQKCPVPSCKQSVKSAFISV